MNHAGSRSRVSFKNLHPFPAICWQVSKCKVEVWGWVLNEGHWDLLSGGYSVLFSSVCSGGRMPRCRSVAVCKWSSYISETHTHWGGKKRHRSECFFLFLVNPTILQMLPPDAVEDAWMWFPRQYSHSNSEATTVCSGWKNAYSDPADGAAVKREPLHIGGKALINLAIIWGGGWGGFFSLLTEKKNHLFPVFVFRPKQCPI